MALVAVVAMLTGCTEDFEASRLSDLKVSSSFVTISPDGGSVEMTITANAAWELTDIPSWLKVDPTSGEAGTTTVKFTAEKATKAQEAVLKLVSNGIMQEINVKQAIVEDDSEPVTVAAALAMIKSGYEGSAKVKGVVCKISEISTQYGNATYFLSDDGSYGKDNWIEVYRGKWLDGESFTKGDEFSVGDILVVRGSVINYNGNTPEFSQGSEVLSIEKSLIKVDSLNTEEAIAVEGGDITAYVTNKGANFSIEIEEAAQDWLFIKKIASDSVVFHATANAGGDRNAKVVFKTSADGKDYSSEITINQKGAIVDATVAEFLAAEVGDTQYRLTGIVNELYYYKGNVSGFYIADHSGKVLVYKPEGFTGAEAKVGDVVTVVGKRGDYNGTAQMTSCKLEAVNYSATAISIADFKQQADSKEVYYILTGTIRQTTQEEIDGGAKDDITQYGNFYLQDESGESVYVYGVLTGWGGKKGEFANLNLTYGDKLTIIAYKDTYKSKGLIEAVGIYLSHVKAEPAE